MKPTTAAIVGMLALAAVALAPRQGGPSSVPLPVPAAPPVASIDLMTDAGVALCDAQWRYADARVVEVPSNGPGPDRQTPAPAMTSYEIQPKAGAAEYDDSTWPVIAPPTLPERRGAAKVSFNWYRINLKMPQKVGDVDVTGMTAVFTITVDDYAEVWVDGALPRTLAPPNPNLVQGFNLPNRVTLQQSIMPGERVQVAVFGINGPISAAPANYIFVREARLEFVRP